VDGQSLDRARDEVLYQQIKDARSLYRGLAVVYALATLAAIVMGVICPFVGKAKALIQLAGFALGLGASAYLSWDQYKDYDSALEEIGPDPTGVDTYQMYSMRTARAIASARLSDKDLFQQWIAYSIIALSMLGLGVLLLGLSFSDFSIDELLLGVGAFLLAGGALLAFMAAKAFHGWRVVRRLSKLQ